MPNGENSWVKLLGRGESAMKNLKLVLGIIVTLITIGSFVGTGVGFYYKLRMEIEAKFATRDMEAREQHNQVMDALGDVGNQLEWNVAATEQLANEIPRAIQMHEYKMHPKEYKSIGSPTRFEIKLPVKPKTGFDFKTLGAPVDPVN